MSEDTQAQPAIKRKEKRCPSCGDPVDRLQLSAFPMPPEQITIPWLQMVNKNAGWSFRTFGQSVLNELQFLCFTNFCASCGHISWWDIGTEELDEIINNPKKLPRIAYTSNIEILKDVEQRLPESARKSIQALITSLTPKTKDDTKES